MSRQGNIRCWSRVLTVLLAGAALTAVQASARALTPEDESGPMTGTATWFDNLGSPYGGCGMPQDQLETQDWIALNVYGTPGDYAMYPRPMPDGDPNIGIWDNGRNCGRWVRVSISDYCTGINDGAPGQTGLGTIQQYFLEVSNVDMAEEMVNMIIGQRAYEANSKTIQTADSMLQLVAGLKR